MKNLYRLKHALLALLIGSSCFSSPVQGAEKEQPAPGPRRPCIVLILAEGIGYGDLGCYGQQQIKTPILDQLAADGMRFTSCYAGSPLGAASRAALMTGRDTGHAMVRGSADHSLSADDLTVSQVLKGAGYTTGMIGKWALGGVGFPGLPRLKGFDESFGMLNESDAHDAFPASFYRASAEAGGREQFTPLDGNENGRKGKYVDDRLTELASTFIRLSQPAWFNQYRPFFLYLGYANPATSGEAGENTAPPTDAPYSNEPWSESEKNRAAMITRMDSDIGRVLNALEKYKADKNTVVIFASVTGPRKAGGARPDNLRSTGALRGNGHDLYEGSLRVPMIIRAPLLVKGGTTSDLPCAMWDFLPTAADIARVHSPTNLDGISLLPALTGVAQTNRHELLYWETHDAGFKQAARMGDWKALRSGVDGPIELYDLKADPGEKNNVAEKNPTIVKNITEQLKTVRTPDDRWPAKTVAQNPKPE